MKKKILALCLVVVLAVTAVTGATLAYFTETEQQTNEFTVGNIAIDLWENTAHRDGTGAIIKDEEGKEISATNLGKGVDENPNFKYEDIMPGDTMEKIVTVDNTGDYDAYIALVVKQENYYDFNSNVDNRYENFHATDKPNGKTEAQRVALNLPANEKEAMQKITDDIFPGWNLLYDKTQVKDFAQVRYTIDTLPVATQGVEVLGVGYAQENKDMQSVPQYHYSGEYFTNGVGLKKVPDGEPDFFTISDDGKHDRVWIIYLKVAPGASFTIDLTTVCPTYFDNDSVQAFANMVLDVKAFAIQTKGFATEKEAFAQALKPGFGF